MSQLMVKDTASMIANPDFMNNLMTFANTMSTAKVSVPKHLVGNSGDCLAVCMQAAQWGMNPFAVAQKTHLVNGNLGYEAQLVNAVVSSSTAIVGRFKYEYGNDWEGAKHGTVRAGAVLKGESEVTWGEWVDCSKVTTKNSPLWKTAPKQQAAYLACKMWARLYTPDVILGVYTPDELEDVKNVEKDITPAKNQQSADLRDRLQSKHPEPEAQAIEDKAVQDWAKMSDQLVEAANNSNSVDEINEIVGIVTSHDMPLEFAKPIGEACRSRKKIISEG